MKLQRWQLALCGQLCLYVCIALCIVLKPVSLSINQGISYFGTQWATILPYAVGLLGSAYLCLKLSDTLTEPVWRPLASWLNVMAMLMAGVVITPVTAGRYIDYLHTTFGTIIFVGQLLISGWLVVRLEYEFFSLTLLAVEAGSGIAVALWVAPPQGLLIQSQLVFQMAFGVLLIHALHRPDRITAAKKLDAHPSHLQT